MRMVVERFVQEVVEVLAARSALLDAAEASSMMCATRRSDEQVFGLDDLEYFCRCTASTCVRLIRVAIVERTCFECQRGQ